jgi:hypothetical protein
MSFPKIILNILLIFLVIGIEESGLSRDLFINPTLCLVIFYAIDKNNFYFVWPLLTGLVLDIFSIFNFPIFTISLMIIFLIIRFMVDKILTFKNYIPYIIFAIAGTVLYNFIFLIINLLCFLLKIDNFLISFNRFYFLHIVCNSILIFLLMIIFRKKYDRSILYNN